MSKLSIIIPAYNADKYIAETIRSVLAQTMGDWEMILINDGSTDSTGEIIGQFLNDGRIHYSEQKNAGVSATRNAGLLKVKGEYIAFLDADDYILPDNFEEKMAVFTREPETDFVFSNTYQCDADLNIIQVNPAGTDINMLDKLLRWDGEVVPAPCSNMIIRKTCFQEGLCFDLTLSTAADMDLCIQLSSRFKGRYIDKPLIKYRILATSMSRNIPVMEKDHTALLKKCEASGLLEGFWFRQKCFSNLYLILAGSWWVDGKNKIRALFFMLRAVLAYPPSLIHLISKIA
jgi:glycosyltransferase involved in cell wall biosynthesis